MNRSRLPASWLDPENDNKARCLAGFTGSLFCVHIDLPTVDWDFLCYFVLVCFVRCRCSTRCLYDYEKVSFDCSFSSPVCLGSVLALSLVGNFIVDR